MPHGTRINGTSYGITGGKCLVGGTVYDIKKGRTLINGTGYDINFSKGPTRVIGSGALSLAQYEAAVNGKWDYSGKGFTYDFEDGIDVFVNITFSAGPIELNGETLQGYSGISIDVTGTLCNIYVRNKNESGGFGIIITTEEW